MQPYKCYSKLYTCWSCISETLKLVSRMFSLTCSTPFFTSAYEVDEMDQWRHFTDTIHHNNKDSGMWIVKTVLCEFALAACNDSSKPPVTSIYWRLAVFSYSFIVVSKNKKLLLFKRHRHADFANKKVHNFDRGRCFANKIFHGMESKFGYIYMVR